MGLIFPSVFLLIPVKTFNADFIGLSELEFIKDLLEYTLTRIFHPVSMYAIKYQF